MLASFTASLLDGRLLFSKYPTVEEQQSLLIDAGVTHIINLCTPAEVTWEEPYNLEFFSHNFVDYIHCPFEDGNIQKAHDPELYKYLVYNTVELLQDPANKIVAHCRGGHNRSAGFAAIVYGLYKKVASAEAIKAVHEAHSKRTEMKDKWRKLGAPQRAKQKRIIKQWLDESS